jgi:hypothetical protein
VTDSVAKGLTDERLRDTFMHSESVATITADAG